MDLLQEIIDQQNIGDFGTTTMTIELSQTMRQFRTANEIRTDGHGNYVEGTLIIDPPPQPDSV